MSDDRSDEEREAELLERLKAGDNTVWPALLAPLRRRLLPMLRDLLKSESEVEDALQEVCLEIYRYMVRFRKERRAYALIWTAAKNKALNQLRKNVNRRKLLEKNEDFVTSSIGLNKVPITPEQATINQEEMSILEAGLEDIGIEKRSMLMDAIDDDDSGNDKSKQGPAKTNQRVALHRARNKLRDFMAVAERGGKGDDQ